MDTCPICSGMTLRHIVGSHACWYCPHCRQEVPNLVQYPPSRIVERTRARRAV